MRVVEGVRVRKVVKGVRVFTSGQVLKYRGERYVTLVPEDPEDPRLWEYSVDTGRTVQTMGY